MDETTTQVTPQATPQTTSQVTTKLSEDNINNSKNAIQTYAEAAKAAFTKLQNAITALCADPNFVGDAANALKATFDGLAKGISTDIYGAEGGDSNCITEMLKNLLDTVDQMRDKVDPQNAATTKNAIPQNGANAAAGAANAAAGAANAAAAAVNTNGGN